MSARERDCAMIPFLPDEIVNQHGFSLISLIEVALMTANHGSTRCFVNREGRTEPVLNPHSSPTLLSQWQLVRGSCMAYAERLADSPAWDAKPGLIVSSLVAPLLLLCRDPSRDEAALFSQWFFDGGRESPQLTKVADRLVFKDFAKLLAAKLRSQSMADVYLSSPWLRGTIAASPRLQRILANWLARD